MQVSTSIAVAHTATIQLSGHCKVVSQDIWTAGDMNSTHTEHIFVCHFGQGRDCMGPATVHTYTEHRLSSILKSWTPAGFCARRSGKGSLLGLLTRQGVPQPPECGHTLARNRLHLPLRCTHGRALWPRILAVAGVPCACIFREEKPQLARSHDDVQKAWVRADAGHQSGTCCSA